MNIFASYACPKKSAQFLDDKRVIKMVLESAQLLSTAINEYGGNGPYKTTHKNHPCAIWTRQTINNYYWLYNHFIALCNEYTNRYNKVHKCFSLTSEFKIGSVIIPDGDQTPFPNCTIFKDESDIHKAYRAYLVHKWNNDKRTPTWYQSPTFKEV